MGYHIQYGSVQVNRKVDRKKQYTMFALLVVLLALVVVSACFPQQMSDIRETIFPFLRPEVKSAFGDMVAQIREGTSAYEAAAAFCREIVIENTH